ncbi:hypothetical protein [Gordonia sp. (in: high G+C Gram-positive bacteria)]|uniref:hypothetical protein n=1 Tax=Gordonia sp. (in: high G+C Gram-positive bacteria) TaxID=84139 RepID=UPI003C74AC23
MTNPSGDAADTAAILSAYDSWQGVLRTDSDEFGAVAELLSIYRQAILRPDQSIAEAIASAWVDDTDSK